MLALVNDSWPSDGIARFPQSVQYKVQGHGWLLYFLARAREELVNYGVSGLHKTLRALAEGIHAIMPLKL